MLNMALIQNFFEDPFVEFELEGKIELDKEGQLESFTGIRVEGDSTRMVTVNAGTIRQ